MRWNPHERALFNATRYQLEHMHADMAAYAAGCPHSESESASSASALREWHRERSVKPGILACTQESHNHTFMTLLQLEIRLAGLMAEHIAGWKVCDQ